MAGNGTGIKQQRTLWMRKVDITAAHLDQFLDGLNPGTKITISEDKGDQREPGMITMTADI